MKVWKYSHKKCWIGALKVVPDSIQNGKPNVETVCDVEANQNLVKTILHLRPKILEMICMKNSSGKFEIKRILCSDMEKFICL